METRQRARRVSYALSRRMGLSRRAHLASLVLELGTPLLLGCAVGAGLALVAAWLVYGALDALPSLPPSPLLRLPLGAMALAGLVTWLAAWVAAVVAQRAADRTRVEEVLRLAE